MNEAKVKQICELIKNNEVVRLQLENTEQIEEIVMILNQNGVDVSVTEIATAIAEGASNETCELDKSALEAVAGGYCLHFVWNGFKGIFEELSQ